MEGITGGRISACVALCDTSKSPYPTSCFIQNTMTLNRERSDIFHKNSSGITDNVYFQLHFKLQCYINF